MIRLRFVREYRGKRIVIDCKLYGVEGELVTDCRYVTARGARDAINSEPCIAQRRKPLQVRQHVSGNPVTKLKPT